MNRYIIIDMMENYGSDWDILKIIRFWYIKGGGGWWPVRKEDKHSWTTFNKGCISLFSTQDPHYVFKDYDFIRMVKLGRFLETKRLDVNINTGIAYEFNINTISCRNNWNYILGRAILSHNIDLIWNVLDHKYDQGDLHWIDNDVWFFALQCAIVTGKMNIFLIIANEVDDVGHRRRFNRLRHLALSSGNKEIVEYLDDHGHNWISANDI
jgi:hypothetical protein